MVKPTPRMQLLGWLDHCQQKLPGKATEIPAWLCSMDVLYDAIESGEVFADKVTFLAREPFTIYRLTDWGKMVFLQSLVSAAVKSGDAP